ncbi:MAG TPA: DUF86 domain-containing protein [Thermoanaerobaculia bacterium]|nr:DUF86 domain-containing protein [Thermoanaerobaculia bacterium]
MVERDVVARKIASATARLRDSDELLNRPLEEFLADLRGRDLTAFYLQLAIQDCIDLASHWVADAGWPPPDDAGSAFDALADHGVIPRDVAAVLRDAVGLRHRIAHGYATLDHGRLYREAREGSADLARFLRLVADAARL